MVDGSSASGKDERNVRYVVPVPRPLFRIVRSQRPRTSQGTTLRAPPGEHHDASVCPAGDGMADIPFRVRRGVFHAFIGGRWVHVSPGPAGDLLHRAMNVGGAVPA